MIGIPPFDRIFFAALFFAGASAANALESAQKTKTLNPLSLPSYEEFRVPNRPVLDLPLLRKKTVLAHFMTSVWIRESGVMRERMITYEDFSPDGITKHLGGESQVLATDYYFNYDKSDIEAAAFHIKTAKKLGIDGFQFFYPYPPNDVFLELYNDLIASFFKAADKYGIDFKFCLCLCSPPPRVAEDKKIDVFAKHIKSLIKKVGIDHPNWMRTPDGRFITYVWNGDYMADFHGDWRKNLDSFVSRLAYAYEKLSYKIGVDTAYIHTLRDIGNRAYMEKMVEYFPAVWHWTSNLYHENLLMDFAAYCKKNKRTFSQPVYPDYYGSKLYPIGKYNYNMHHFLRDVIPLKVGDVEKDYYRMGVTDVYINYLERILKTDTPLVSFITYNDYPEGHHVAPELNHNFGFSVLFNHYKNVWTGNPQKNDREFAVLAYKKYKSSVVPFPFDIRVDAKSRRMHPQFPPESDDFINVVTFLKAPAEIIVNGKKIGTAKGEGKIEVFKTPLKKGKVRLEISRGGKNAIELEGTEWITDKPYRTDRITYCICSLDDSYYGEIFGKDAPRYFIQQYAEDKDGTPFWKLGKSVGVRYPDGTIGVARENPAAAGIKWQ